MKYKYTRKELYKKYKLDNIYHTELTIKLGEDLMIKEESKEIEKLTDRLKTEYGYEYFSSTECTLKNKINEVIQKVNKLSKEK